MTSRSVPIPADPELERLLAEARQRPPMTAEEREAQRRSWVIGEMLLEHPDMTREYAEQLYESLDR